MIIKNILSVIKFVFYDSIFEVFDINKLSDLKEWDVKVFYIMLFPIILLITLINLELMLIRVVFLLVVLKGLLKLLLKPRGETI